MNIQPGESMVQVINRACALLTSGGIADPLRDVRLLLSAASGMDAASLIAREAMPVSFEAGHMFSVYLTRRMDHEPVSRILGHRAFWKDEFIIDSNVLDPRPGTETIIEAALHHFAQRRREALRILDLGTGSGAIICALLREFPAGQGLAIDISRAACQIARLNLERLRLAQRCQVRTLDWTGLARFQAKWMAVRVKKTRQNKNLEFFHVSTKREKAPDTCGWDMIVSNPPYIESDALASLEPDVRLFDPVLALDGGRDGLDASRSLAPVASMALAPEGLVLLEIGYNQSVTVPDLLERAGLNVREVRQDLGGMPRVVVSGKK